jgi:hypothetical protein
MLKKNSNRWKRRNIDKKKTYIHEVHNHMKKKLSCMKNKEPHKEEMMPKVVVKRCC